METNLQNESGLTDGEVNDQSMPANANPANEPKAARKRYHYSAMYAASRWHGTVAYVKSPNAGHGLLPVQP